MCPCFCFSFSAHRSCGVLRTLLAADPPKPIAKVAPKSKQSAKQTSAAAVPKVQPECSEWPCGAQGGEEGEEVDPDGPFWEGRFVDSPVGSYSGGFVSD